MSIILLQYKKITLRDLFFCLFVFAKALFLPKHDIASL